MSDKEGKDIEKEQQQNAYNEEHSIIFAMQMKTNWINLEFKYEMIIVL